jgi:hypothetical protein
LKIEVSEKKIMTTEITDYSQGQPLGGCRAYCGAQGSFADAVFSLRSRKLFYPAQIKQIKRSREYTDAAAAYEAFRNVKLPVEEPGPKKTGKHQKKK